jgi:hypothetical protein
MTLNERAANIMTLIMPTAERRYHQRRRRFCGNEGNLGVESKKDSRQV